jgi:sulfite exporter TauE/SafE
MPTDISLLVITAASIGFLHTLFGPDHYLPFIMISRARSWSVKRTIAVTVACGLGHVLSSVLIGIVGVVAGIAVGKLEALEAVRGELAAWALIAFGLAYAAWGVRRAILRKGHAHTHLGGELVGVTHVHQHNPALFHSHDHSKPASITPWVLFTVFVLGPCEPLIPILMYPAAQSSSGGMVLVTLAFALTTIMTMTAVVVMLTYGYGLFPLGKLERFSHAIAGLTIAASGLAIQFLGL